jgi:hypothetical protein
VIYARTMTTTGPWIIVWDNGTATAHHMHYLEFI